MALVPEKPYYLFPGNEQGSCCLPCGFLPYRRMLDNNAYSHGEALKCMSNSLGQLKFSKVLAQNVDYPAGR